MIFGYILIRDMFLAPETCKDIDCKTNELCELDDYKIPECRPSKLTHIHISSVYFHSIHCLYITQHSSCTFEAKLIGDDGQGSDKKKCHQCLKSISGKISEIDNVHWISNGRYRQSSCFTFFTILASYLYEVSQRVLVKI